MWSSNLWLAFSIIFLLMFLTFWWKRTHKFYAAARKIPGLNGLPFVGNIVEAIRCDFDSLKIIKHLEKYRGTDGIVKFWRCHDLMIVISDPSHHQIFYTNEALDKRSDQYDTFDIWLDRDNILTAGPEQWKRVRKMMVQSFCAMNPDFLVSAMISEANSLTRRLNQVLSDDWIYMGHHITKSGYRLFTKVALDEDLDHYPDLEKAVNVAEELLETVILRVLSPLHFLNLTFPFTKEGRNYYKKIETMRQEVKKMILRKKSAVEAMAAEKNSIPNRYLYNLLTKYGNESLDDVMNQFVTLYSAGVDTTATAMGFAVLMIAIHKDVQENIYKEDFEIQKWLAGKAMEPGDYQHYEYLERVIKETIRLYPVFPMIGREAKEDVYLGEYLVPKGSTVFSTPFWTNRREDIFPNPLIFNPERFLPEKVKSMHPYAFTPFSAGIKNCIGNKFAMMSLKTTIAALVRNFKISSEYRSIAEVDNNIYATVNLIDKGGIKVKLEKRY